MAGRRFANGRFALGSLALALLAAAMPAPAWAVAPGDAAPALQLPGRVGAQVQVPDKRAKLTYVDFWASWCGPCRQSFPWLNQMQSRYGAQGLRVVGVNLDAKTADAEQFLKAQPAQFEVAFDPQGASGRSYALKGMPSSVLLGSDGRVLAVHSGFRAGDGERLEALIKTHLGKP